MGCGDSTCRKNQELPILKDNNVSNMTENGATKVPPPPVVKKTEKTVPQAVGVKDNQTDAFGLLLCGAGESGKTTFTRQLRLRYLGGFTEDERKQFVNTIRGNMIETIQLLLVYLERNNQSVDDSLIEIAEEIANLEAFGCDFNSQLANDLASLWEDPNIAMAFQHKDETPIPDHMEYFFNKIDDLVNDHYLPSDEDILRARIRTIGIDAVTFNFDDAPIRIYDVGGQKNERSKWSRINDEVESVIYCVSFADFDKYMFEDSSTLRIHDALENYSQVNQNSKFKNGPKFLLCNKIDVFNTKIRQTDSFIRIFPEYSGDYHDPEACAEFLIQKFKVLANDEKLQIYRITALDADQVIKTTDSICKYISDTQFE